MARGVALISEAAVAAALVGLSTQNTQKLAVFSRAGGSLCFGARNELRMSILDGAVILDDRSWRRYNKVSQLAMKD